MWMPLWNFAFTILKASIAWRLFHCNRLRLKASKSSIQFDFLTWKTPIDTLKILLTIILINLISVTRKWMLDTKIFSVSICKCSNSKKHKALIYIDNIKKKWDTYKCKKYDVGYYILFIHVSNYTLLDY